MQSLHVFGSASSPLSRRLFAAVWLMIMMMRVVASFNNGVTAAVHQQQSKNHPPLFFPPIIRLSSHAPPPPAQQQQQQHLRRVSHHDNSTDDDLTPARVRGLQQTNNNNNNCSPLSQIGNVLRSGANYEDQFGVRVSSSQTGQYVAVGASAGKGSVQVFEYSNTTNTYTQRGTNIDGVDSGAGLSSNALSNNGNILATGAHRSDGNGMRDSGQVGVYQFVTVTGDWQPLGNPFVGQEAIDHLGISVALSGDGMTLATGAMFGGPNSWGQARVFTWNNGTSSSSTASSWIDKGDPINGSRENERFGLSLSLSESGGILAVGANSNSDGGLDSRGRVRVFEFSNSSNSWDQLAQHLYGEKEGGEFGWSVSLSSDGHTVAIGAPTADSGYVQVYELNENPYLRWGQRGNTLTGDSASDRFGDSVSLSGNGLILAVGAEQEDVNSVGKGFFRVFQWNGLDYQQLGNDIEGTTADDDLGTAVAVSRDGSTVVAGGDATDTDRPGMAMVMKLDVSCQLPEPTVSPTIVNPTMGPTTTGPAASPTVRPTVRPTIASTIAPTVAPTIAPVNASASDNNLVKESDSKGGMSTGALVGIIVVGCFVIITIGVAGWAIRKYRTKRQNKHGGGGDHHRLYTPTTREQTPAHQHRPPVPTAPTQIPDDDRPPSTSTMPPTRSSGVRTVVAVPMQEETPIDPHLLPTYKDQVRPDVDDGKRHPALPAEVPVVAAELVPENNNNNCLPRFKDQVQVVSPARQRQRRQQVPMVADYDEQPPPNNEERIRLEP